ncbi:MAG: ankyrin repeat domain-containing protein [Spirochaetaceae bacterium]|nr:ankyrin repeat domain-containing protein [Spirochaetaceae bacterium]
MSATEADRPSAERFFRAAEQGDLPALRELVAARPDLVRLDRAEDDEHTALHYAVLNRDLACTRFLLEAGADPHNGIYPHRDATSPLTLAEDRGYGDVAALIRDELDRRAAQAGADPERGDELFDLIRDGDLGHVERLLDADPQRIAAVDAQGRKPLHAAAAQADLPLVRFLAARDERPSQPDAAGLTPLDCAVLSFGWTQRERAPAARAAAQVLLDAGAEQTPRGAAALGDLAFLRPIPTERLQQATGNSGGVLTVAVTYGQPAVLDLLLAKGLDPEERIDLPNVEPPAQSSGMPLWHAAAYGEYAMAETLLDAGADVNAMVYASGPPMERAYGARDERMKALLRRRGAVVYVETIGLYRDVPAARDVIERRAPALTDRRDRTAYEQLLWAAACGGEPAIIELCLPLVERPPDDPWWSQILQQPLRLWNHGPLDGKGFDRTTYPRCLELILAHGVDPDVTGHHGFTTLQHVAQAGETWGRKVITEEERVAFATLLLDAGAGLTRRDPLLRSTPLGWACRWGREELARLLIDRGAAVDEADAEAWATPLAWASGQGHGELAALLRRHGARR